ncbi:hypothetical protein BDV39DRAFT_176331 [Aspergillus sergii]|uniref:Phenol hydroxylase-like C-terminal dimerisation domain-containing protein n=1 Tax=Aspergillus sergii TaxID=1034303 RepID=A0A5N6X0Z8_9EURO|nr:hypothetical protein BDV39DRAFT_176331 [Aspergillus sergii]
MRFHSGYEIDDVYAVYGVDPAQGALAVIRPDGYVGTIAALGDVSRIERYIATRIETIWMRTEQSTANNCLPCLSCV